MPDGSNPSAQIAGSIPAPHPSGAYFRMSAEEYHADPSLGSSDLKSLPPGGDIERFWINSRFNPDRVDNDTDDKLKGSATHKMVLEPHEFERSFIQEIDPANHPGALVTAKDLESFCRERKIAGYSGKSKPELIRLVKEADPEAVIWDEVYALFQAMVARDGLKVLKPKTIAEVREAAARLNVNEHLRNAFRGGAAEVSVFWVDENGVPCKARYDWLKPRTIIDLKKCDNTRNGRPFDFAIRRAIVDYRYDIQAAHYLDGYKRLYAFAQEGRVFGTCPLPKDWPKLIAEPQDMKFTFVFHTSVGAPICKGVSVSADSSLLNRANHEIPLKKRSYLDNLERFGPSQPWYSNTPIMELTEADLPAYMREFEVEEVA